MNKERELDSWCNLIMLYTKERVENDSVATRWIFDRITHDEWVLSLFPKHLASIDAYTQFYNMTGKDIRDFDWNSSAFTKDGIKFVVHQLFTDEHLTTAHDFKYELIHIYKQGKLTVDTIKELISKQRLCWITKDEDKSLSRNGFRYHRNNPLEAYKISGIRLYDVNNSELSNIMKPSFDDKANNSFNSNKINLILKSLKDYFSNNLVNNRHFDLSLKQGESYAWIYKFKNIMINIRTRNGSLKDICLYIEGNEAKQIFNKIKLNKEEIELKLGYELVWDENKDKKSTRIGRFFKDAELHTEFELANKDKCFDFNIDDINYLEKTAQELISFYNVFKQIINNLF